MVDSLNPCNLFIRAKTREKDTYFEDGIVQSLENRGSLWKKLMEKVYTSEFIKEVYSSRLQ